VPKTRKSSKTLKSGIPVFFATNRDRLSDAFDIDAAPGPGGDRRLWLGRVTVEALGDPEATEAPRGLLHLPDISGSDDFADAEAGDCARTLGDWLDGATAAGAVPLLFIHGFANTFNGAVCRAAQLVEFYAEAGARLAPLAFCWPSDGKLVDLHDILRPVSSAIENYRRDQRDAMASGPALARLLREVQWAKGRWKDKRGRIILLAHSMGNHVLAAGLTALSNGLLTVETKGLFDQAVLMAADEVTTSFGRKQPLAPLPFMARQVTVGTNVDPVLSDISTRVNDGPRLGFAGPANLFELPPNVAVVDCFRGLEPNDVKERLVASVPNGGTSFDIIGHQYYRNDRNVRKDLAQVFAGAAPDAIEGRRALGPEHRIVASRGRTMELEFRG
jgi:esterase/lipase superfamily enzyme